MALKDPTPGLRRFVNDSVSVAKLDLRVAPGAEIAVDDATAAQLPSSFKDPDVVAARDAARATTSEPAPEPSASKRRRRKGDDAEDSSGDGA
jgi:hypothetical protein